MGLKRFIMRVCQKNEWLYLRLRKLNRTLTYWRSAIARKLRGAVRKPNFRIDKTLWVAPSRIHYKATVPSNKFVDAGRILPGDWDREGLVPFEEYVNIYSGMEDLCVQGKPWKEIPYFRQIAESIRRGSIHWGCRNVGDLEARTQKLRALFRAIREHGYKAQEELHADGEDPVGRTFADEVSVHIGRDGRLLFGDGAHRLAIAKLLGLPRAPVRVVYRHPEWVAFRQELLDYAEGRGGKIYHPVTHPDLQDIPVAHAEERLEMIRPHLPAGGGAVLDIGAHWGYFCHELEELGFECYAVEADRLHFHFLEKLRRAEGRSFRAFNVSIFDFRERDHFAVMLALNIFHHFIKTRTTHEQLVAFLGRIQADVIFFQPHVPGEFEEQDYYRNYDNEAFVDFVLKHSGLGRAAEIGRAHDGRPVYKLESGR